MSYSYTLTIGAATFSPSDMEKIIDSSTLRIVKPFCSTKKTSGTGTMSVTIKGAADPLLYQSFMVALLGAQQAQEVKGCGIVVTEDGRAVFRGYLDLSTIQINSARLPQNLTLSAKDRSILLDRKIRMNKAWEDEKRSVIISELLEYLGDDYGTPVSLLSDVLPATKRIRRFAVTEAKEQTYRDVIDRILLESAGYVLWYDPEYDGFRVMAIQTDIAGLTPRTVGYLVKNQLQTKSEIYEKDGVLLSFPNVTERKNTNIYTENISVSVDEDNNVIGQDIPSGHYFPSDGDIKEIYQQYRVPDRPYISHESRLQNEDLRLIYCKDVEYSMQCNPMLSIAPSVPGVKWYGEAEYYPDRARLLFINNNRASSYFPSEDTIAVDAKDYYTKSGNTYILIPAHSASDNPKALGWYEAKGANLSSFSITGTAVYEDYLNKVTVGRLDPDANGVPCTNPEEYRAETIQYMNGESDFSEALDFAKWYYRSLSCGQTISQWTEFPGASHLGEVVYVAHKMTGVMMPHIVVQITDESIDGSRVRMNRVVAISIYGWEEYVYDNGISANGNNGQATDRANTIATGDVLVGTATCRGVAGIAGDIYINTDENSASFGNMYRCIVSGSAFTAVWEYQANIKGSDASVTGMTYEIEYGLSTSDEEFIFPVSEYGYDAGHTYGHNSSDSYGFVDYRWSESLEGWYHGLYVWQRIKITDAQGNVTYEEPTYAKELTQSLSDSCTIEITALPSSYTSNMRKIENQYLFLNIKDIGYKGTLILRTDAGIFSSYNAGTGEWTDLTNALTIILNGTGVLANYGIKLPYAMDSNVTVQGDFEEWTEEQFSIESLSICPSIEKTPTVQLATVDTYADLPTHINRSSQDADINDNLIKGDYILVKFLTLTATSTTQATDETGKIWNITELSSYYDSNLDPITVSAFVVGNTYYAFAIYAWTFNGIQWVREATSAVEVDTVKEAISLAQAQHDIDGTVDYHRCLYAHEILVQKITASVINVGNIFVNDIESTNYTESADGTPETGYKLIHDGGEDRAGEIKSVGGVYANMNVRGALKLWKEGDVNEAGANIVHPSLETVEEQQGDNTGVTADAPDAWKMEELTSRLAIANADYSVSGSFGTESPTKLLKLNSFSNYAIGKMGAYSASVSSFTYYNDSNIAYFNGKCYFGNRAYAPLYRRDSSGNVETVATSSGHPFRAVGSGFGYVYYAADSSPLYRSATGDPNTWEICTSQFPDISRICVGDGIIVIFSRLRSGSYDQRLYYSTDGGFTFTPCATQFSLPGTTTIENIYYDPQEKAFYLQPYYGSDPVYRSTDGSRFTKYADVPSSIRPTEHTHFKGKYNGVFYFADFTKLYYTADFSTWGNKSFLREPQYTSVLFTGTDILVVSTHMRNDTWESGTFALSGLTGNLSLADNGTYQMFYSGAWHKLTPSDLITFSCSLSGDISFNSANFIYYGFLNNFLNYTSYTYTDSSSVIHTVTLENERAYRVNSTGFTVNGVPDTPQFFIRNSPNSVTLICENSAYNFVRGARYFVTGTIGVANTKAGVRMRGQYPKEDQIYDLGSPDKYWNVGYIVTVQGLSKRSEKHEVVPYTRKAIDIINKTEIVNFKYIKDRLQIPHIGFIAEDTDKDLSGQSQDSFMLNDTVAVLIKAAQELSAQNELLAKEIEELKKGGKQ